MKKQSVRFSALVLTLAMFVISAILVISNLAVYFGAQNKVSANGGGEYMSSLGVSKAYLTKLTYNGLNISGGVNSETTSFSANHSIDGGYKNAVRYKIELPSETSAVPTIVYEANAGSAVVVTAATNLTGDEDDRTTKITVTQDTVTHYYLLVFSVATIPSTTYYSESYNADKTFTFKNYVNGNNAEVGGVAAGIENAELKIAQTHTVGRNNYIFDESSSFTKVDASYHAKVRFDSDTIQFGLILQGKDQNNHATLNYDSGSNAPDDDSFGYHVHNNNAAKNPYTKAFRFEKNVQYDLKAQIVNKKLTVRVDNKIVWVQELKDDELPPALAANENYKFGIKFWKQNSQNVYLDDVYVADAEADPTPPTFSSEIKDAAAAGDQSFVISSSDLKVVVGNTFPFIYRYENANGGFLANGIAPSDAYKIMVINGKEVLVDSEMVSRSNSVIIYKITAVDEDDPNNKINAEFTVALKVMNGQRFRLEFTDIVEKNDSTVRSFYFANHNMISLKGSGAKAALGKYTGWGPMQDEFLDIESISQPSVNNRISYIMLNQGDVSASIENNATDGERKYIFENAINEPVQPSTDWERRFNVTNNAWHWNALGKDVPMLTRYATPYSEVIFGGDENANGTTDWQDAGLLHRKIMYRAFGSEDVKDYWSYIAMNMSSLAGNPSLRILDRAKAISYLTDGFGQKIMNKGYQVGGHDDSHGDYDNISVQQGGIKDFEYLNTVGKKYNASMGIHINATEFALDGFETKLENMRGYPSTLLKNWDWLDQAYLVDKDKDLASGELQRRISELKDALPNLGWVYIDVWQSGSKYTAKNLAGFLNDAGYSLATEAAGDFVEDATMFHWNTDLYYPSGGSQSEVIRFVQNDVADKFAPDKALLSMTMPGVAGWRNVTYFNDAYQVFYRNNLAAKYMQYFTLEQWEANKKAVFSGGVASTVSADGKTMTLTKDTKDIARIDVSSLHTDYTDKPTPAKTGNAEIFIPWDPITEEKIYYFNDNSDTSTWDIPNSWAGLSKAYLYKLTPSGRVFDKEVTITDGKCEIAADKSTPYILSKTKQDRGGLGTVRLPKSEGTWGEGSEIRNFGFTGETFEGWEVSGEDVKVVRDLDITVGGKSSYKTYSDPLVKFTSAGTLNQTLKVEGNSTYTISAWVYTVRRKATLKVTVGDKVYTKEIFDTDVDTSEKPSKYMFSRFQRLNIDVPIPSGCNEIQLSYTVDEGKGTSVVDDFRSWKWQTPGTHEIDTDKYLVKEDFENVDEGWGPFVSTAGYQPHIHLAQKDLSPNAAQIKDYVINGQWSLKINNTEKALHMRTLPSTVNFATNEKYYVKFNYQAFMEYRHATENVNQNGFNMPITDGVYEMNLYNKKGEVILKNPLKASKFKDTNYTYNSEPSTEVMYFEIPVGTILEEGAYLGLAKTNDDIMPILIMDDLEIGRIKDDNLGLILGLSLGIPALLGGGFALYWFLIRKKIKKV